MTAEKGAEKAEAKPEEKKVEEIGKDDKADDDKPIKTLTEEDVRIMQAYGAGPYSAKIKGLENEVRRRQIAAGSPAAVAALPLHVHTVRDQHLCTLDAIQVKELSKKVNEIAGIKESDTGLAHPSRWDLVSDKQMMQEEQPLQVSGGAEGAPH
jgi:26S proteasome regulatory subunit T1